MGRKNKTRYPHNARSNIFYSFTRKLLRRLLTGLIADRTGSLASGLTRCLALAAAALLYRILQLLRR